MRVEPLYMHGLTAMRTTSRADLSGQAVAERDSRA